MGQSQKPSTPKPRFDAELVLRIFDTLQLGFTTLKPVPPTTEELEQDEKMMSDLHTLLLETQIMEGSLVCGNCGHEYKIKEGIANFLLPNHLV